MNSTIKSINDETMNLKVRELTKILVTNRGKLFRAVFTKKDGSERTMKFTTATNWNALNGIETTEIGKKMIETKVSRNMATVTEVLGDGKFQPRTLNLEKVITLEMVG